MKRKIIYLGLIILMLFMLTGCKDSSVNDKLIYNSTSSNKNNTNTASSSKKSKAEEKLEKYDFKAAAEKQMKAPEKGETVAIFHVKEFGDIKVKFFNDIAPKAVENFVTHAKEGYYNGTTFHRVMEEFMIQGGDPKGDGTGGESIWGKGFGEELDLGLVPYRGALCMASAGTGKQSLGSQFFIVQANYDVQSEKMLKQYSYPENLIEEYRTYGGYLSLYQSYTVFGQVYEGMDVVDSIAKVAKGISTSGELSVPITPVVVESIEVKEY